MSLENRFGLVLLPPILIGVFGLAGCQELQKGVADMQSAAAGKGSTARNQDNVELTVTATPSAALPGQKVMYEITVRNGSKVLLWGFNLSATIPQNTTVSLTEASAHASCSGHKRVCQPAEQITWGVHQNANLKPGSAISVHFYALVDDKPPAAVGARLRSVVTATKIGLKVTAEPVVR